MSRRVPNNFVRPGKDHVPATACKFKAMEEIPSGAIVVLNATEKGCLAGSLASATDLKKCQGKFRVSKYNTPEGYDGIGLPWYLMDLEIPGAKDQSLLYLTKKGQVGTSPPVGAARTLVVGRVLHNKRHPELNKVLLTTEGLTNGYGGLTSNDVSSANSQQGSFPITYAFEFNKEKGSRTIKIPSKMIPIDFKVLQLGGKEGDSGKVVLFGNDAGGRGKGTPLAEIALDKLKAGQFSKSASAWKAPDKMRFEEKGILEVKAISKENTINCLAIVTLIKLQ